MNSQVKHIPGRGYNVSGTEPQHQTHKGAHEMNELRTTCYVEKAQATRSRRQAKGLYAKPSELAIYRKTIARGGDRNLTPDDIRVLAGCKWLPMSQQRHYQALAAAL